MNGTFTANRFQCQRVESYRNQTDSYRFFNLLTSNELLSKIESLLPEHRERLFPPTETLSLFLAQVTCADRSCQHIVNQSTIQRVAGGMVSHSTFTGGYYRARQRLPLDMVVRLTRHLGALIESSVPATWNWKNRRVLIADGTTLAMPDTSDNQAAYPQMRSQAPGTGFPICRLVGITSLASGVVMNAAMGPYHGKGSDEQSLLRSIQDTFQTGDIILGDAYYSTYFFIAAMQRKGVDIVMEQYGARRRTMDFRRGIKIGCRDRLIEIEKPAKKPDWMSEDEFAIVPATLTIRELEVGGKILVTTMLNAKYVSKDELKSLYKSRWNIELDIRQIKDTMGMAELSCKTPEMVRKEIWTHLLAYNLIRLMLAQSAILNDITPRTISFKHCIQLWLITKQLIDLSDEQQLQIVFELIAQRRIAERPGRIEPRAVKKRNKPYPLLMKSRHEAREEVKRYGHAKKLK